MVEQEIDATCQHGACIGYVCTKCGYQEFGDVWLGDPIDCDYETIVVSPSCTEWGYTKKTCKMCQNCFTTDEVEPTGHTFNDWIITKYPTQQECGSNYRVCTVCDYQDLESIPCLTPSEGLEYRLLDDYDEKHYAVWGIGTCTDTHILIPESYQGLPVTYIYPNAFANNTQIKSVTFSDSILDIGAAAFLGCTSLERVTFSNSIEFVRDEAFKGCVFLSDLAFPSSLKSIGKSAFEGCTSLNSLNFPSKLLSIYDYAFKDCDNVKSILLSSSIDNLKPTAFENCKSVDTIVFGDRFIDYDYGMFANLITVILPNTISAFPSYMFEGCNNLEYKEYDNALYLGSAENPYLVLVKAKNTNISSCEIHPDARIIADGGAFAGCKYLQSISIPDSITNLGSAPFLGSATFEGCSALEKVILPNGVTTLDTSWFKGCAKLTDLYIPDSIMEVRHDESVECPLFELVEYNNAWYFGNKDNPYYVLFKAKSTSITSCKLHPDTKIIAQCAFINCTSLKSIAFNNSLRAINKCAFEECSSLTNVSIPDSVAFLGLSLFNGCYSLSYIDFGNGSFSEIKGGSIGGFLESRHLTYIEIPESVTKIGDHTISASEYTVVIPHSVKLLGQFSFSGKSIKIIYDGTKEEWKNILDDTRRSFDLQTGMNYSRWYSIVQGGNVTVQCNDGILNYYN